MRSLILACTLICCIGAASAQTPSWPERTAGDVEAAYKLIYENHPGMLPELGDAGFPKKLAAAREDGLRRAVGVTDYMGYVRAMRAFSAKFEERHVTWAPSPEMMRYTLAPAGEPGEGSAGLSVETSDGTFWIGMQSLSSLPVPPYDSRALVTDIEAKAGALRAARRVVIDLRGNSGDTALMSDRVLSAIYSPQELTRLKKWSKPAGCSTRLVNRATPGTQKAWSTVLARTARVGTVPPQMEKSFRASADKIGDAIARGQKFDAPFEPECVPPAAPAATTPPPIHGRVIVVTDYACQMGCLTFLQELKSLSAVHVGQTTRAMNWYGNELSEELPSGLGTFTTMMGVNFDHQRSDGPFEPTIRFDGAITSTAAVKAWVAGLKI